MTRPPAPLIEVRALAHTYLQGTPLETRALFGVDLQVHTGETVGIIGPTGSGKSTLLQHLNGLLRPQQGDVLVNGTSLSDPAVDIRAIRQCVGLVFQSPEDQLFERYAGDDVAFGPRNLGLPREEVRSRVRRTMEMVGLPFAFKDRLTADLSQGQRRRLALAGVLALEPQVLVLDEPTAGLDPQGRRALLRTLSSWGAEDGRATVLASHNMEDIAQLCDRLSVLVAGQVILRGSPREVFSHYDTLVNCGLSVPVPTEVMVRLLTRGYQVPATALTTEEAAQAIEALVHARNI
ncbi:MAG TPA: energy-coupling factor transporter ATPase [Anaerolineae bacterium]|nr:energy-coupling factor transporter ATPase [Anaerolineae bacterium]